MVRKKGSEFIPTNALGAQARFNTLSDNDVERLRSTHALEFIALIQGTLPEAMIQRRERYLGRHPSTSRPVAPVLKLAQLSDKEWEVAIKLGYAAVLARLWGISLTNLSNRRLMQRRSINQHRTGTTVSTKARRLLRRAVA